MEMACAKLQGNRFRIDGLQIYQNNCVLYSIVETLNVLKQQLMDRFE